MDDHTPRRVTPPLLIEGTSVTLDPVTLVPDLRVGQKQSAPLVVEETSASARSFAKWLLSAACGSGVHCAACRGDVAFQTRVAGGPFACPFGVGSEFEIPDLRLQTKVRRLWGELRRWRKAGYKLADRAERARRLHACETCPHYAPRGNLGLGQCKLCGCTRAKLWLASAKCPHPDGPRW